MEEIQNTDAGEGLGHDVGEDGAGGVGVHRGELGGNVVELGERVDDDEDVGDVEPLGVPEHHPGCQRVSPWILKKWENEADGSGENRTGNTEVSDAVIGYKVDCSSINSCIPSAGTPNTPIWSNSERSPGFLGSSLYKRYNHASWNSCCGKKNPAMKKG